MQGAVLSGMQHLSNAHVGHIPVIRAALSSIRIKTWLIFFGARFNAMGPAAVLAYQVKVSSGCAIN